MSGAQTNSRACEASVITTTVLPAESYALTPPVTIQSDCLDEDNDEFLRSSPVQVVELHDARVWFDGARCLVLDTTGQSVREYGVDAPMREQAPHQKYRPMAGTTVLLGDSSGAHCYYHWMVDLLPKLGVLERAGYQSDDVDRYLTRELVANFQRETVQKAGVPLKKVHETRKDAFLRCERLLIVRLDNTINMRMNRFVPLWLKHTFQANDEGQPIKLYISRPEGVRRGIANEADLLPLLREAGYTVCAMEGMSVASQAALLSRAEVVISPHGGALTNMIFQRPGARVLELFGRHVYPFYYGLSQLCQHRYHAILETAEDYPRLIRLQSAQSVQSVDNQLQTRFASFEVNRSHFKRMLAELD